MKIRIFDILGIIFVGNKLRMCSVSYDCVYNECMYAMNIYCILYCYIVVVVVIIFINTTTI